MLLGSSLASKLAIECGQYAAYCHGNINIVGFLPSEATGCDFNKNRNSAASEKVKRMVVQDVSGKVVIKVNSVRSVLLFAQTLLLLYCRISM